MGQEKSADDETAVAMLMLGYVLRDRMKASGYD